MVSGGGLHCWVCGYSPLAFERYGLPPRPGRCPNCKAKPRHRSLIYYLGQVAAPQLGPGSAVLEIGPGKIATRWFPRTEVIGEATYTAVDVRALSHHARLLAPHSFESMDVTAMAFPAGHFDLIICNNTLPYVFDYQAALREIARCLKRNGMAIIDTQRAHDRTVSVAQFRALFPQFDDAYFAENGDQWVFGPDFLDRVTESGLTPWIERPFDDMTVAERDRNGLKPDAAHLVAFTDPAGEARFPSRYRVPVGQ